MKSVPFATLLVLGAIGATVALRWPTHVVSTVWSDWQISEYASVTYERSARGIDVRSETPPGGLRFTRAIDRDLVYELNLDGRRREGRTIVRIRLDDGQRQYFEAPEGTLRVVIAEAASIEVLVYGSATFRYEVRELALAHCPECPSDRWLREHILSEVDGLAAALADDPLLALRQLLQWAADVVDFALDSAAATRNSQHVAAWSAAQTFTEIWETDAGGTYCSGMAIFFDRIIKLFGFDGFTINIGVLDGDLTHVTNVVAVETADESRRFYLFDPTFNAIYVEPDTGGPVDLLAALDSFRVPPERFELAVRPIRRSCIRAMGDEEVTDDALLLLAGDLNCQSCRVIPQRGVILCKACDVSFERYLRLHEPMIRSVGLDPDRDLIMQLLLHRIFGVGEAREASVREDFIGRLETRGLELRPH